MRSSNSHNDALTYFDKALTINPNNVEALHQKGLLYASFNSHNDALTYFDKALSINQNHFDTLLGKAISLAQAQLPQRRTELL
ncbi:tetratricopeptide repeat protein [Candidatus Nitrosotenuis chungbukensis]|uniref:tetratricopeptide repeat protein n=1 Tax=Candidatus Nitrosotenuis chungbukensis TaxID=1353246 RepID=UPI002673D5F4|nr:tetratricopeptide repeat protein [Candidatus Nitrosotenuis chungbukensis]WKT58567.1 tetratricopeptide repeat protein [Candidatus Nitrosotenuis chungbukensis]